MAQDLLDILDHAGAQQVHWVGNSLGGILALFLLGTSHKKRLRSLALFGTCFSMNLPPYTRYLLRGAFLPGAPITAWLTARTTTGNPTGQQAIENAIRQFNVEAGAAIVDNVRQYDFVANTLAYENPLLLLWGGRDYAVNLRLRNDIDKFAGRPNFTCVDLPQAGHCANFDMPAAFAGALEAHWNRADTEPLSLDGADIREADENFTPATAVPDDVSLCLMRPWVLGGAPEQSSSDHSAAHARHAAQSRRHHRSSHSPSPYGR